MLLNISYNRKSITEDINEKIGKPFSLVERLKMSGIGSGKLKISSASIQIHNLLILDNNLNVCSIELRPKGILVSFRSILETYALIIPYYKLKLYKGQSNIYSIFMDNYFIKVEVKEKRTHTFMKKILQYQQAVKGTDQSYY